MTEPPDRCTRNRRRMVPDGIPFPMLSDGGGRIGRDYGIYDESAGVDILGRSSWARSGSDGNRRRRRSETRAAPIVVNTNESWAYVPRTGGYCVLTVRDRALLVRNDRDLCGLRPWHMPRPRFEEATRQQTAPGASPGAAVFSLRAWVTPLARPPRRRRGSPTDPGRSRPGARGPWRIGR